MSKMIRSTIIAAGSPGNQAAMPRWYGQRVFFQTRIYRYEKFMAGNSGSKRWGRCNDSEEKERAWKEAWDEMAYVSVDGATLFANCNADPVDGLWDFGAEGGR